MLNTESHPIGSRRGKAVDSGNELSDVDLCVAAPFNWSLCMLLLPRTRETTFPAFARSRASESRLVTCSKLQTDFSEMMAAGFISECISDLIEAEAAIDDGLNAGSLNCSKALRLMLAATYYQALKPSLFGHQVCGRDLTGSAS